VKKTTEKVELRRKDLPEADLQEAEAWQKVKMVG
jgi:hypothetical protein